MAGGNHPKPPPHSSSSSSSAHRKSRWEPNSSTAAPNSTAKSPADPKPNTNDPKAPKPSPKTKPNLNLNPNPSPKQHHPHHPSSDHPPSLNLIHFPEPPSLPPPPAYGFHMLERRTIVLADGSVRSYFALPADYQHLPPPRPLDLRPFDNHLLLRPPRHPDFRNPPPPEPPSSAAKRKYGDDDELARQREQLLRNANQNGFSSSRGEFSGVGPSELRPSKQLRGDGVVVVGGGGAGVGVNKHQQVDQEKLKKAFLHFAKLINENAQQKKSYLEDGKQGRLQCIACGRFGRIERT